MLGHSRFTRIGTLLLRSAEEIEPVSQALVAHPVPILRPFPDVARHAEEAIGIGLETADGGRADKAILRHIDHRKLPLPGVGPERGKGQCRSHFEAQSKLQQIRSVSLLSLLRKQSSGSTGCLDFPSRHGPPFNSFESCTYPPFPPQNPG